jgi:hypothetical protein
VLDLQASARNDSQKHTVVVIHPYDILNDQADR